MHMQASALLHTNSPNQAHTVNLTTGLVSQAKLTVII